MSEIIDVFTGQVKSGNASNQLLTHAIGSCVIVTAFDAPSQTGAMAHVMLPGKAPEKCSDDRFRYAQDAIDALFEMMQHNVQDVSGIEICLIGGANVLQKADDSICRANIHSVQEIIKSKCVAICASALGGILRRTARLDVSTGAVYYSQGDQKESLLWQSPILFRMNE